MQKVMLMLVAFYSLLGCSFLSDSEPQAKPTKITISMFAANNVNPNSGGDASPIEIQLFELNDDSMLLSADYDQIQRDYKKALKSNFVENYDYVLTPNQFKFVNAFEVDSDTNYIGVVAHFSDPESSEWKKTIKIINKSKDYHLLLFVRDFDVILEKVE